MNLPTEEELRELVRMGIADAAIGERYGVHQREIQRMRKRLGIAPCHPQYSNGAFIAFEREIRALMEKDAEKKLAGYRFEDSPAAIRAQAGGYGQLPPRASFGTRGGSMVMVENC